MDKRLFQLAEELAERPYQIMTFLDKTTDGEPVYVSLIPELPGCASHGATIKGAVTSLREAMVEFIYFMLEDDLTVPEPRLLNTVQRINASDYMDNIVAHETPPTTPRGELLAPLS